METELQYYARRAAEELQAAARAASPDALMRHRTIAEHYATLVQEQENAPHNRGKEGGSGGDLT
jgi:hypothetical protein